MTIEYPSSYHDEYDALRQMIALSGRAEADIAVHLFPEMKRRPAHTRLLNCLNPHRRNVLTFGKVIEAMRFCGRFDPLMHAFDQLQKPRPCRIAIVQQPDDSLFS